MSEITKLCRKLRNNMTEAETLLWEEIRNCKTGCKFRRQHPLNYWHNGVSGFFITDFICLEKKLIVEVDGEIHNKQKEMDFAREFILRSLGYKVIRFRNEDVLESVGNVVKRIIRSLKD